MHIERSRPRFSPTDYVDFKLNLQIGETELSGYLGNVSEGGLGAILPGNQTLSANSNLEGVMTSKRLPAEIRFRGKIAWLSETTIRKAPHTLLGIQFDTPMSLPEELIAIELAAGND